MGKWSIGGIFAAICVLFFAIAGTRIWEEVDADEIVICQSAYFGTLHFYTSAGTQLQYFGNCEAYPKAAQVWFLLPDSYKKWGDPTGEAFNIRFNDQGKAVVSGGIRAKMPLDEANLRKIHETYGSWAAVEKELVERVLNRAVYMTGPLMSSKESASDRRTEIISYIEDQALNGNYKTLIKTEEITDEKTGLTKEVKEATILTNEDGTYQRQNESELREYGITVDTLDIKRIEYDPNVLKQIDAQRDAEMQLQTAIVRAAKAKQDAITAEQEGKAAYERARWKQEEVNAVEIAVAEKEKATAELHAQKELEVAKLDAKAASEEKKANILRGEGEAARKRAVMNADGALEKKLKTYEAVQARWAEAFEKHGNQLVPSVVMGGEGKSSSTNGVNQFMELLSAQAAKDLSLNLKVPKGKQ